ncbi:hypothetical protein KCU74_g40, partial [Aureobasidium melanogenum]
MDLFSSLPDSPIPRTSRMTLINPFVQRHSDEESNQRNKQCDTTDDQRLSNLDLISPEVDRFPWMLRVPVLRSTDQNPRAR